jgi:phage tail-like protein
MPSDTRPLGGEPPVSGRFLLEVDGVEIGVFSEVSGLELTVGVEEYAEGGQNGFVHKLPGRMSWPNLVFRRGITDSDALFSWVQKSSGQGFAANGNKLTRSTGAITLIASDETRLRSWNLDGVFPVRWTGPRLSVKESEALEEELEVAHAGFKAKTS